MPGSEYRVTVARGEAPRKSLILKSCTKAFLAFLSKNLLGFVEVSTEANMPESQRQQEESRMKNSPNRFKPLRSRGSTTLTLTLLLTFAATAQGQTGHTEHHEDAHHTLGVFLGDTTEDRRDGLTLGLEYEYRATPRLGIGLTAEHVSGDFDTNVFVLPVAFHSGPWKAYAGPGVERGEEGNETLLRVGIEYGFHFGEYELSPQLDVDFVEGERLLIFGLVFAREF